MRRSWIVVALLLAGCRDDAPPPTAPIAAPANLPHVAYFDAASELATIAPRASRHAGAIASSDPHRGTPRAIRTREPAPSTLAVTPELRARGATSAPAIAALWHADRAAPRWNVTPSESRDSVVVAHVHDLGHGAIVVKLRQRIDGLDVERSSLSVVMDRDLALVGLFGGLVVPAATSAPALSGQDAIGLAFADVGVARPMLGALPDRAGYQRFTAPHFATPARVKPVAFAIGDRVVRAWATELGLRDARGRVEGYRHVFAADDGRLLLRTSLTADAAFQFTVWAETTGDHRPLDGPQGDYTPHPTGLPDGFDPPYVAPVTLALDGFNHAPGGGSDPWLAADATTTSGNNVQAYADVDSTDGLSGGDVQPTLVGPLSFARTYDLTAEPAASAPQRMAAVADLFYLTDWLHDYWYDSGFVESAGVAQVQNYGRGGVAGDPLHAEGQDSSGTDNANMSTPADGESPTMQMYVWTAKAGEPRPDGTIDHHIVEHEWGHYLHHRLVDCGSASCGAMSEGWGDFDGLLTTVRAGDDLHAAYGMGAYALRSYSANSAYFGIRRYPYSTDLAKSPLTFRFVASGVALPPGIAHSEIGFLQGADNWEVHDAGEIWCGMLWQGLVDELAQSTGGAPRFTFEAGRRRYADYVVGGMIAAPTEPSFTEQRDAILAVADASDPIDGDVLARAYAKRGFGTGAISPLVDSANGGEVREAFAVTGALDITGIAIEDTAGSCDHDGFLDVGETGVVHVTVHNAGREVLAGPTVALASTQPGVSFPGGGAATLAAIAPHASATVDIAIALDEGLDTPTSIGVTVAASDASAALASVVRQASDVVNLDVTAAASASDEFDAPVLAWTATPGWARTGDVGGHAATAHVAVLGDDLLASPGLVVQAGQTAVMTVRHRFALAEAGGVIEVSTDGVAWQDVTAVATEPSPYAGTIASGALAGRAAFTGTSAGYPGFATTTLHLGASTSTAPTFVRFRAAGVDRGTGTWDLDAVAFTNLSNTPFPLVSIETGSCLVGQRPLADAGVDQSVPSGAAGALDGTGSHDPDGGLLTYTWTQTSGLAIQLSAANVAQPTFTAPTTPVTRTVQFELVVRDPDNRVSIPSLVRVHIVGSAPPDAGAIDAALPDAAVDAEIVTHVDGPTADAPKSPAKGDGGGCSTTSGDGGLLLVLGLLGTRLRRRFGTLGACPS